MQNVIEFATQLDINNTYDVYYNTLKTIDLLNRGVYYIEAQLYYGCGQTSRQPVAPVGIFSCPATLDSFVDQTRVEAAPVVNPCSVDYDTLTFHSRTVIVRFNSERMQLNEGVHWRFTVPTVELSEVGLENLQGHETSDIICPEPASIEVSLIHAPFLDTTGKDVVWAVEEVIPEVPAFTKLATQVLQVPEVRSGTHAYFPVHFDRGSFVCLHTMVHIAATAVHFMGNELALEPAVKDVSLVSSSVDTIKAAGGSSNETSRDHEAVATCNPLVMLFEGIGSEVIEGDKEPRIGDTSQISQRRLPETTKIKKSPVKTPMQRIKETFNLAKSDANVAPPFPNIDSDYFLSRATEILNYNRKLIFASTQRFVSVFERKGQTEAAVDPNSLEEILAMDYSNTIPALALLKSQRSTMSSSEELVHRTTACNSNTSARWSLFLSLLPQIEFETRNMLILDFSLRARGFWKLSLMVHTVYSSNITRPHPDDEGVARQQMQIISAEALAIESAVQAFSSSGNKTRAIQHLPGRGLKVTDRIYCEVSKLPVLIAQQYVSPDAYLSTATRRRAGMFMGSLDEVDVTSSSSCVDAAHERYVYKFAGHRADNDTMSRHVEYIGSLKVGLVPRFNPVRTTPKTEPIHLVVMQHGFEGCYYDMRHLQNFFRLLFPHLQIYVARSNQDLTYDSIDDMGKRLAEEILTYCKSTLPKLLYPTRDSPTGRISFIGHSMGGLIIRRALEEPCMEGLRPMFHVYISLATPHLGTSYAQSQLVATGMWAIMKWRKCSSLQQLSLEDAFFGDMEKTLLFKLSSAESLRYFKRVILVSSPADQYVPSYSARVQVPAKAENDKRKGSVIMKMAASLLSSVKPENLIRLTLLNNVHEASSAVDNFIGRAAHICYLDNPVVVEQLAYSLFSFFSSS